MTEWPRSRGSSGRAFGRWEHILEHFVEHVLPSRPTSAISSTWRMIDTTAGRSQLVSAIGDLMGDHGRILTLQERALINDILKKLIQDVARPVRKALAEKLALSPHAPREVVTILANDEFDIASPILLNSSLLEDDDLMEIVRHRTISHRLAVAMRRTLSERVCEELVATNSVDVIQRPAGESRRARSPPQPWPTWSISRRPSNVYQEPLLRRADLPAGPGEDGCITGSRRRCGSSSSRTSPVDPVELDLTHRAPSPSRWRASAPPPAPDEPAVNLARQLAERQDLTPDIIVETLRRGETPLFEAMLGERIGAEADPGAQADLWFIRRGAGRGLPRGRHRPYELREPVHADAAGAHRSDDARPLSDVEVPGAVRQLNIETARSWSSAGPSIRTI